MTLLLLVRNPFTLPKGELGLSQNNLGCGGKSLILPSETMNGQPPGVAQWEVKNGVSIIVKK